MMRSLFLFLLLLNILYALWQLQDGRAVQSLRDSADQQLEQLPVVAPAEAALAASGVGQLVVEDVLTTATLCVNLGVFASAAEAEQLRQRLLALSIGSAVISRDVSDSQDYWLVMSVQGGQREAMSRLALMQDEGIDSFIITQGRLANHLSLGVFSRQDYALARQAQLESMGYSVRIEVQEKLSSEYLVQVDSAARRLVDQALLARLRQSFPALQHQFHPCKAVAN